MMAAADWAGCAADRCRRALTTATAAADRLALFRSLVRLCGGRLDLEANGHQLSEADTGLLQRFGLSLAGDGAALRIAREDERIEGLEDALRLDSRIRQVVDAAPPDGVLLRFTSHVEYRSEAQKAAVRALLTQPPGSGLMVSMPTGSGKSLLFQLAALYGRSRVAGTCAIVITPTIALALDHVRTLSNIAGLEGSRALTGDLPPGEAQEIVDAFRRGEVPVLFLSPEKALSAGLIAHLAEAASGDSALFGLDARLTHLFVDEAHIVESWGRSFRPDFQRLPGLLVELRAINPEIRAVLLSATLPPAARQVLRSSWKLDGDWLEVDAKTPRYEHDILAVGYESDEERAAALDFAIDRAPRPAIVYTTQVARAVSLAAHLHDERGYRRIALFTGETGAAERKRIVAGWAADDYDLVVATSAFGMGIDKPDVRSVIHACLPESPARWYQEIGRASRDRGQGLAACLFTTGRRKSDVSEAYSIATSGWLSRELAEERWAALLEKASDHHWDENGRRRMTLDLDSVRETLERRRTDYNRGWNMALLTLMQRSGVIQVRAVSAPGDQPGSRWDIEILSPEILDKRAPVAWDRVFEVREQEQAIARSELKPFEKLMLHPSRQCVTRSVFELIEPHAFAPPCGRCPACRKSGAKPPARLPCGGLESVWNWQDACGSLLPGGAILLRPDDASFSSGFSPLIDRLANAGIEQFIVAPDLADETAQLAAGLCQFGFILTTREMEFHTQIAAVPTALFLPQAPGLAEFLLERMRAFSDKWPTVPLLIVAEPDRLLSGRRLDQSVTPAAPIAEEVLDMLALSKAEAA
jgi:ATP-dependent DNA helicase RecQ